MSSRSLALGVLIAALPLSVDTVHAQQRATPRFVRSSVVVAPADSGAIYRHAAQMQRRTGSALVVAGLGAIAAAYVQLARSGERGMNGAQAATFVAGTAAGVAGVSRWAASHESLRLAEHYRAASPTVVNR